MDCPWAWRVEWALASGFVQLDRLAARVCFCLTLSSPRVSAEGMWVLQQKPPLTTTLYVPDRTRMWTW